MAKITMMLGIASLTKIKKIDPLRSPTGGREARGDGRWSKITENYGKLLLVQNAPKQSKKYQKKYFLNFCGAYEDSSHEMASVTFV